MAKKKTQIRVSDIKSVVNSINMAHGDGTAETSPVKKRIKRLSSGIFDLDLATGGGFPVGKLSIIYGKESSNKTNVALSTIAIQQKLAPKSKCVFFDIEHSFDPNWATAMGVNVDILTVITPNFGEEAVDMVEAVLSAEDVGLIVIDSIAALIPMNEIESESGKMQVGGNSMLVTKLMHKVVVGFVAAKKRDHYPTIICINQLRNKIGVSFGNPEKMPGGLALHHVSGLTLQMYAKNVIVADINPTSPAFKECHGTIKKYKVPIASQKFEFSMAMIKHKNIKTGQVNDFKTICNLLRERGDLIKEGTIWLLNNEKYKNLQGIRDFLWSDLHKLEKMKMEFIDAALPEL